MTDNAAPTVPATPPTRAAAIPAGDDTAERRYEVTPLELFFDLVFVFAVSQLSHHLLAHLSWRGAAETLVMLLAVLTVWSYTSWAATIIRADRSRPRGMLLAVMLLGLFMNASVTRAFTTSAWMFVVPLLTIERGETVWTIVCAPDAVNREHSVRVLLWFLVTTPLWILGAATNPEARLLWWGLAAGLELVGTWLAHPVLGRRLHSQNVPFDADHMLERCRLFLIIALGETVLTTGMAIAESPLTLTTLVTGTSALLGTTALWALSFGRGHTLLLRYTEETCDPIRASRYAVNALMVLVAGLIALAVANEKVIPHPQGPPEAALSLLLFGGPTLFLAAQGWYLWIVLHVSPRLYLVGCAVLVLVGLATRATVMMPSYVSLLLVGAILTTLALCDQGYSSDRDSDRNPDSNSDTGARRGGETMREEA